MISTQGPELTPLILIAEDSPTQREMLRHMLDKNDFPFIVLAADNSNQIRTARKAALARGIPCTDFTDTMTVGTSQQHVVATRATPEGDGRAQGGFA